MKKIILILIVTSSALTLNSGASKNRERQLFNTILTEDNVEIVRDLIQNGVKINIIHDLYSSPLILAIKQNRPNILKLLLENGANPNTKDLSLLVDPLYTAVDKNDIIFTTLLLDYGAKNNINKHERETPLHLAAKKDSSAIAQLLIDRGADVNAKDYNDNTPLHNAVNRGSPDMVKLLLSSGADDLAKNKPGLTPLDIAKKRGFQNIVDIFTEYENSFPATKSALGL